MRQSDQNWPNSPWLVPRRGGGGEGGVEIPMIRPVAGGGGRGGSWPRGSEAKEVQKDPFFTLVLAQGPQSTKKEPPFENPGYGPDIDFEKIRGDGFVCLQGLQVLGRGGLNHSFGHLFEQNCPNLFWCTNLSKTAPNLCLLNLGTYSSKTAQNLFWDTYLSKTAQNLIKDFEEYIQKTSELGFCYGMLHESNELDY